MRDEVFLITMMLRLMLWGVRIVASIGAVCWRFAVGLPLSGKPRTDATWLRRGARRIDETVGDPFPWSYLPGWERMAVRWVVVAYLVALVISPVWTNVVVAVLATPYVVHRVRRYRKMQPWREHMREFVDPLDKVLREIVPDLPPDAVHVPMTYDTDPDTPVVIQLPDTFVGGADERAVRVRNAIAAKLSFTSKVTHQWESTGLMSELVISIVEPMPSSVTYEDVQDAMEAAPEHRPVLGMKRGGGVFHHNFGSDSAHLLYSAGSGGGKSVFARTLLSQPLHEGNMVVTLDVKKISQAWMRGLPGVVYCRSPEMIHNAIITLAEIGIARFEQAAEDLDKKIFNSVNDEIPDDGDIDVGRRIVIVCEEMNQLKGELSQYWEEIKPDKSKEPSPAIKALNSILFLGRQAKMHVFVVGQYLTADSVGGPAARENFATRALSRCTANAWGMLAPQIKPIPTASEAAGRCHIVTGNRVDEVQVAFLTPTEARQYARAGIEYDGSVPLSPMTGLHLSRENAGDLSPRMDTTVPDVDVDQGPQEVREDGRPALRVVQGDAAGDDDESATNDDETNVDELDGDYMTVPEIARAQFLIDPRTGKPSSAENIKKQIQRARKAGEITDYVQQGRNVRYERESVRIWWENRPVMRLTGTNDTTEGQ